MAKRKKKQIYCKCGSKADWYKKGKKHRVLICDRCGMIANNPIPLIAGALMSMAPSIIEGVKDILPSKKEKSPPTTPPQHIIHDSLDRPNRGERTINKVLYGE